MARDFDNTLAVQRTTTGKETPPQMQTQMRTQMSTASGPMPSRQQSIAAPAPDGELQLPTPDSYMNENPTVPHFLEPWLEPFERHYLARYIGGTGFFFGLKHRSWLMGCSACLSFIVLLLLIIPLLATSKDPDVVAAINFGKGTAHWELIIPIDWTTEMYLGLGGMTNKTRRGDTYYVPYTDVACREVFKEGCDSCQSASLVALIFICISIATVGMAFCLDLHRIFQFFDLNMSKVTALVLHLVFGVVFTVMTYIIFVGSCISKMPTYAVHGGDGRKGIGLHVEWSQSICSIIMIAVIIIRPIPGILHFLVPTPHWANNKGLKLAKNKRLEADRSLDPFDTVATSVMRGDPTVDKMDSVRKPMVYAVPMDQPETVVAQVVEQPIATSPPVLPRKESTNSQASTDSAPGAPYDEGMVSSIPSKTAATALPTLAGVPTEAQVPTQAHVDADELTAGRTGEGTAPGSRRDSAVESVESFVDPFDGGEPVRQEESGETEESAPAEADVATRPMGKKTKKTNKKTKSAAETATRKM